MAYSHSSVAFSFIDLVYTLVLLFCSLNNSCVYGARQEPEYYLLPAEMKSLPLPSAFFASTKGPEGQYQNDQQKDHNGPLLPTTVEKSMRNSQRILLQDYSSKPDEFGEGIILPLRSASNDGDFLVTVGFGTPQHDFNLFFDTGSDVTWIQCQTCTPHCNTQFPIFNTSSSSTFSNFTNCTSCDYKETYHDDSYSDGYYVKDTLTITSDQTFNNFVFGCAQNINGNFGEADGLLGVGRGKYSLLAQTDPQFVSLFCYCLPATDGSVGYLAFGAQAYHTCLPDSSAMVPMIPSGLSSYLVSLIGITIGQQRLDISSYQSSSSLQAVLDSGTPITRLPPLVYSALGSAFRVIMSQYPATNSSDSLFDTCYNLQGYSQWTPPNIVLHFEGPVDVNLDESAAVLRDKGDSQVCLAFARNDDASDLTIIGNRQHRAINIFFDLKKAKLAFQSGGCKNL